MTNTTYCLDFGGVALTCYRCLSRSCSRSLLVLVVVVVVVVVFPNSFVANVQEWVPSLADPVLCFRLGTVTCLVQELYLWSEDFLDEVCIRVCLRARDHSLTRVPKSIRVPNI